jgi:dihydrofolate synthase/folylpolyglutamate synthase
MSFFESLKEYQSINPGLSRIKNFLSNIGNPQNAFKTVHIAGTNGKGSTAVFISEILKSGGYKTGVYTSPHLINITERIKIDDKQISKKTFNILSKQYLQKAEKFKLSYFEYLTALGFIYFAESKVDIAVVETGLGGRFDATNIILKPLACVITSIAKDHQEILGNTIKKIAFEKSGIIKKGSCVICGKLSNDARIVVNKKISASFFGKDFKALNVKTVGGIQKFDYSSNNKCLKNLEISLLGEHQIINASVAVCVSLNLIKKGCCLNDDNIRYGLKTAVWQGRFDIRDVCAKNKKFRLIIDGAHNIDGVKYFLKTFKELYFADAKKTFIFAVMKEKKYKAIIKMLLPFVKKIILFRLDSDRAVVPEILEREFLKYLPKYKISTVNSFQEVCDMIKNGETAAVIGSLYLAGKILKEQKLINF